MAAPKRKQPADTETLRTEAQAALEAIDKEIAELDRQRLDLEPQAAVTKEIALAASRRDAQRRIELLDQRAAEELRSRQSKNQAALIERVEKRFEERNQHITRLCNALAVAVVEMENANAANNAILAAWPWSGPRDNEPLIVGKFFRAAIRNELYRLSGKPFVSANDTGDFPGSECPTPLGDVRPSSVRPLAERARTASHYAGRIMREAPIRSLPPTPPPAPAPAPVEIKPNGGAPAAVAMPQPEQQPRKAPQPEYVYHVEFRHKQTGEQRTEEVKFGPAELEEASLDGLGGTGPRAKEIALRIATDRAGNEFIFAGSLRFDANRLIESLNRD